MTGAGGSARRAGVGRPLLAALAGLVVLLAQARLFFGVEVTDEAYYVAVASRFAQGATPYLDELSVPQTTTAVLLAPFVWAYHGLVGWGGVVLFMRELHLLAALAVGGAVVLALRRSVDGATALLAGLVAFLFVPYAIPSVGYDALGSGLFSAGCLLAFWSAREPRARLGAGALLGLAGFAYPPLLPAVVLCALTRLLTAPAARRSLAARLALPALALPLLGFAALAALAGPGQIASDYRRASHFYAEGGGADKLRAIERQLRGSVPHWPLLAAAVLLLLWAGTRGRRRLTAGALLVGLLAALPAHPLRDTASLAFVEDGGLLALPLLVVLRRRPQARELVAVVWLPALIAGLVAAYASTNGGINIGVGFAPALLVTLVLGASALARGEPRPTPGLAQLPALLVVGLMAVMSLLPVYRDGPLWRLDAPVGSGPFAGLVTTSAKRTFLTRLERDLAGLGAGCSVAFFDDFPAGYLLSDARPDTDEVWTTNVAPALSLAYQSELERYYERRGFPDVAVLMWRIPYALPQAFKAESYPRGDPLLATLRRAPYRLVVRRQDYAIYRRSARC